MTISVVTSKTTQQGNNATTVWNYGFPIPNQASIAVTLTDPNGNQTLLTFGTQYTVTGLGNAAGGTVTYPLGAGTPLAPGNFITIQRVAPYQQLTSLTNQGGFYPSSVEGAIDYAVELIQQLQEQAGRALTFGVATDMTQTSNRIPQPAAGLALGWDPTGKFLVNIGLLPATIAVAVAAGGIIFASSPTAIGSDPALVWDNVNKRQGIGIGIPTVALDVAGSVKASSSVLSPAIDSGTTGSVFFKTNNGTIEVEVAHAPGAVNQLYLSGASTGNVPLIGIRGSDTNVPLQISSQGAAGIFMQTGLTVGSTNPVAQAEVLHTASAVNFVGLTGAITGAKPTISAQGSDTNVGFAIATKGTGVLQVSTGGGAQFQVLDVPSATISARLRGAATAGHPLLDTSTGVGVAIEATNTNDIAGTGQYGERLTANLSVGAAINLANGTPANVVSLTLGPGDWDVDGVIDFIFGATTSYTNLQGGTSSTSATFGLQDTFFDFETPAAVPTAGANMAWVVPKITFLLSTTTTIFLVVAANFTVSTLKACGTIKARRMR